MTGATPEFALQGFSLVRILSDRENSKVFLAKGESGAMCAVKLQRPTEAKTLQGSSARYGRIQPLSRQPGLFPILSHGITKDGWVWESLPLADNLPGLPTLTGETGIQQYTPETLRAWTTERGVAPAVQVARWGVKLAQGLGALHSAGLIHRDVKPSNILFLQGEPRLSDYGLVGEPGSKVDSVGTEGFQPLEGTNDAAADLFALGKTLYETWTGADRLEFPSVPRTALNDPDWDRFGSQLNEVILRACHAQPRKRFRSAEELATALSQVGLGQHPMTRRRWLAVAASVATVAAGALLWKSWRPPARVVWRRVREKGFAAEGWQSLYGTADWKRKRMYSFRCYNSAFHFQSVDLESLKFSESIIPEGSTLGSRSSILHPGTQQLWTILGGRGQVIALDPDTGSVKSLGGGPDDRRHYDAAPYWNPVTKRVGVFGGYGEFAVTNDRSEFDESSGQWLEIQKDLRSDTVIWPRTLALPFISDANGRRIFAVGGLGNPSGKQGKEVPGLRGWEGRFHRLDDVWELNLESNTWRQLLPLGHLDLDRLRAVVYHPILNGLVIFEGIALGSVQRGTPSVWLLRPDTDKRPRKLAMAGDTPDLTTVHGCTLDPRDNEVLLLAEDGIFRVAVKPI